MWVPSSAELPGNLAAHNAARAMTEPPCLPIEDSSNHIYNNGALQRLLTEHAIKQNQQNPPSRTFGQYTWRLDAALRGKHTRTLYGQLKQHQAAVLIQARSGYSHLNAYKARIGVADSCRCSCDQGAETVEHIVLRCPKWDSQRTALVAVAGPRWGDMSYLLGGYSSRKVWSTGLPVDGPKDKWKPQMEVVRATIDFLMQTGRMMPQEGWRSSQAD